jgi:Glycosyltransferase family 10 (fucosyltransferase).
MEEKVKKISVVPFYREQAQNRFFGEGNCVERDNIYEPYRILKKELDREYFIGTDDIIPIEQADIVLFFAFDLKKMLTAARLKKKSVYFAFEPTVVDIMHEENVLGEIRNLLGNVMTWNDDLKKKPGFVKFFPPVASQAFIEKTAFSKKKFLVNISSNKTSEHPDELYTERRNAIRYFEKTIPNDFDLYGMGWSDIEYQSYRGEVENKQKTLKGYKYCLCYENMRNVRGLVSEKIFDCFFAGCIPIYLGADNIEEYIPKMCFVDFREFKSYEELENYLQHMTEKEYAIRLEAINQYIRSAQFQDFLGEGFAKNIQENILNLYPAPDRVCQIRAFIKLCKAYGFKQCMRVKSRLRRTMGCFK